jgi:hypothetical protein
MQRGVRLVAPEKGKRRMLVVCGFIFKQLIIIRLFYWHGLCFELTVWLGQGRFSQKNG